MFRSRRKRWGLGDTLLLPTGKAMPASSPGGDVTTGVFKKLLLVHRESVYIRHARNTTKRGNERLPRFPRGRRQVLSRPPHPRDGEQFRSFWLLFPSTLFSFLLLMGLIIFSEKTHDLGRGVTAGGHWAPAGAACVCVCLCVWLRLLRTAPRSPWLASVGCWCPAGYRLRWVPGACQADPGALRKKQVQAQDLSLRHRPQAQTSAAQAVCAGLGAKEDSGTLPPLGVTAPSSGLSSRRSG